MVRSPGIVQGLLGGLKQMVGGNIEAYAEVCEEARRHAYERMVEHAAELGADAVIGMRYDATEFAEGVTEVLAYGTAVKLTASGREAVSEGSLQRLVLPCSSSKEGTHGQSIPRHRL